MTQSTAFTSRGQLLFDEVGLGRTIEAGLILSRELRRRRTPTSHSARRKALIIVPSALHEQWKSELHHKFGLDAEIFSPGYSRQRQNQSGIGEGECWERTRFFVLMAYAGLRPNEVRTLVGRDIRWNGDTSTILVRHGLSAGVLASPKTGPRKVPILGLWRVN